MTDRSEAKWIWIEDELGVKPEQGWFLRDIRLDAPPPRCVVRVCADSRYNLAINGEIVLRGPCRSRARFRCYDELDIAPYLRQGYNRLLAEVIHYSGDIRDSSRFKAGPASVESTMRGGFLLKETESGLGIDTNEAWLAAPNPGYQFLPWAGYLPYMEKRDVRQQPPLPPPGKVGSPWRPACEVDSGEPYIDGGLTTAWILRPRPIPFPYENKHSFSSVYRIEPDGERRLIEADGLLAEPRQTLILEADPGEYTTAFPLIQVKKGRGAKVRLYYTEKAQLAAEGEQLYTDSILDEYILDGESAVITPFYYRAFRKLGLRIDTEEEPLELVQMGYRETGYPLSVDTEFRAGEEIWNDLWDISVRTLRRCMYETYMDCPYYEQMQYLMDTMLQMTFTYQVSGDDRLARKAIDDFAAAQLADGLIPCHAPARIIQLIPGFNAYFFLMLSEHYRHQGDGDFIRRYLPAAKRVFQFFMDKVDTDGLIKHTGYWQFVDWVEGWEHACPTTDGENYLYSMMFSYAFQEMAWLCGELQCSDADIYRRASDNLNAAIRRNCYDRQTGLYLDGREAQGFSQHAQLWAVLCGAADGEQAAVLMTRALQDPLVIHRCSFCMTYFLFRALEKSGCYAQSESLWVAWTEAARAGNTTWAEDPISGRSMCHAWSAIPLYELIASGLGIRPLKPGYKEVSIEPKMPWIGDFSGCLQTPRGPIQVRLTTEGGQSRLAVTMPAPTRTSVRLPDGRCEIYEAALEMDVSWERDVSTV